MNKLSICIPTYNRKEYLIELLDSIFSQINDENRDLIQICISDNFSSDNSKKLIEKYIETDKVEIILNINESNIGPDLNFLKVVEIATGDYCWLMGSDDVLNLNALDLVLSKINNNPSISVFLGNRDECDKFLKFNKKGSWLDPSIIGINVDFTKDDQTIDYFNYCRSLGGVFSFLSSVIVKKSEWDKVVFDYSFVGSAYSHVYMVFSILNNSHILQYFSDSIVKCRFENDSFFENTKQRFFLDLYGYYRLFKIFKNKSVRKAGMYILTKEHPTKHLYTICLDEKFKIQDMKILKEIGYPILSIFFISLFSKFNYFFNTIRPLYRLLNINNR